VSDKEEMKKGKKGKNYKKSHKIACTIPLIEDCEGFTALDMALDSGGRNVADVILTGAEHYPFLHSGPVIVRGINKAFA
jgi:hypothetical protein